MSSATLLGSLHKRICTFSPRVLIPSVVTAFCVDIRLTILDRVGWVYQHATEHLHMDASVKHLYQAVIGQTRIWLEEHKRNFTFRREQRLLPAGTLVASTCELCCQLLDGKLGMDTPKFAFCKAITVVLQKIKFCKGQTGCYIRNFLYLHDVFLTNFPRFCP